MRSDLISCQNCRAPLPVGLYNLRDFGNCPACGHLVRADVFPTFVRHEAPSSSGERILSENEASCFYHPEKKAAVHCSSCGRFLCALCDMELGDEHLCPRCLEAGSEKKKNNEIEKRRVLYDRVAFALAVYPLLFVWLTVLTAPLAIYMAVRHWRSPLSVVSRTRGRLVAAFIIASMQIAGWVALLAYLMS